MIFISGEGGGAGSRLTQDVGNILSQLPVTVEALTGVNITKGLEHYLGGGYGETPSMDAKVEAALAAGAKKGHHSDAG